MKFSKIPCEMKVFANENEDSNLLKVRLKFNKTGKNYNYSKFSEHALRNAEGSLCNIPILGYLKALDEDGIEHDYDGHNVVTQVIEDGNGLDIRFKYLERPIGVIPESANIQYEYEEQNDSLYAYCDGYIWKSYANEGLKVLMDADSKSVSMEIRILDGETDEEDGYYDIKQFEYLGVTVLGDDVPPAIEGACLTKYENFSRYKNDIADIMKEIYAMQIKEGDNVNNDKNFGAQDPVQDPVQEPVNEEPVQEEPVQEPVNEEPIVDNDPVQEPVNDEPVNDEPVQEPVNDEPVNDEPVNDEPIQEEPVQEPVQDDFSMFEELLGFTPNNLGEVLEKFTQMNNELEELREYKKGIKKAELKVKVEDVTNKFSFNEEEIQELKDKALNEEISVDQYQKELYCLLGMKQMNVNVKSFSKKDDKKDEPVINIMDDDDNIDDDPIYGSIVRKTLKK